MIVTLPDGRQTRLVVLERTEATAEEMAVFGEYYDPQDASPALLVPGEDCLRPAFIDPHKPSPKPGDTIMYEDCMLVNGSVFRPVSPTDVPLPRYSGYRVREWGTP